MKRITGLLFSLVSFIISCFPQSKSKPNIIVIMTDDLGYTDLSCYGNQFNETPNIDSLANGGIRFTNSYSSSPVSSPSRAGFLTGKHPARLQLTNFLVENKIDSASPVLPAPWKPYLNASELTIAEVLQSNGYKTGIVGKWHLGNHDSIAPWNQGFNYTRMIGKNSLDYYNYSIFEDSYQKEFTDNGTSYLTDKLTDYAEEFISENKEKPFYLYLAYTAPHVLLVPKGEKLNKYLFKYNKYNDKYNPYYAAMIESIDEGVGRLVSLLKNKGLLDNTLIVFTSDNGGVSVAELGPVPTNLEPLNKWKGHVYEGGIRIPTIVYWKNKITSGNIEDSYFSNIDFFPTFTELCGININPDKIDGKSINSLLFNNSNKTYNRGPLYWHYPHFSNQGGRPAGAVRQGKYKLIENFETGAIQLFDLEKDISESKNLVLENPQKANEIHQLLIKWRKEVNASMVLTNPLYKSK